MRDVRGTRIARAFARAAAKEFFPVRLRAPLRLLAEQLAHREGTYDERELLRLLNRVFRNEEEAIRLAAALAARCLKASGALHPPRP